MPVATIGVQRGALGSTAMRIHELAIVRWLNSWAFVREGYAVPVLLSSPLDAFAHFAQLWAAEHNPFKYLLDLKDDNGTPLYQPHPAPVRYPIISVQRKGWKYRPSQSYSIHRWRHLNWPTVSDTGAEVPGKPNVGVGLHRPELGEVTTARRPMAFDFNFQIDHFCNRPDTQAFFIEQLVQQMWRTGGITLQTWMNVPYPGYGDMLIRVYISGDIDNATPEEPPDDKYTEFRTSFNVTVEGYFMDLDFRVYPAFWKLVTAVQGEADPADISAAFTLDTRLTEENPTLDARTDVPANLTPTEQRVEEQTAVFNLDAEAVWQAYTP